MGSHRGIALVRRAVAVIWFAVAVAGCADAEKGDLCAAYFDYVAVADPVLESDPTGVTAAEAAAAAGRVRAALSRVRAVADGAHAVALNDLDARIGELITTLDGVDPNLDAATWAPLINDTFDEALDADHQVRALIGPVCAPRELSARSL